MKKQLLILPFGLLCGLQSGFAETTLSSISGAWYDPDYNGSGFNMVETEDGLYAYFYGYKGESDGEALWLLTETAIATPIVVGESYTTGMRAGFFGNGGSFTSAPTADNSGTESWGTVSFTFNSCDSGVAVLSGNDGDISYEIDRLTGIDGLTCSAVDDGSSNGSVNASYFLSSGLAEDISTVTCTFSDGSSGDCYKIVTNNTPGDSDMGPWCPENITDDASKGGIWLESGEVYDVDGAFIQNLASFYNDNEWQMYDSSSGEITITATYQDFVNAANPNVGEAYKNYCVEGKAEYVSGITETFYIPVTPKKANSIYYFSTGGPMSSGPSVRGLAFNGVRFDAPAPTSVILAAYTIAPFDDVGGHLNPYAGYHYHAATGNTTEIAQSDGHAPMIGYALDGYAIYANTDVNGNEATDLDSARGHTDDVRGYHYHVDKAGNNNFIDGLAGVYVESGE